MDSPPSPAPGDFLQVPEWSTGIPVGGKSHVSHSRLALLLHVTWFTHELLYIHYVTDAQLFRLYRNHHTVQLLHSEVLVSVYIVHV